MRGRRSSSSSGRPASAEPWWETLRISTGGSRRGSRTFDSASAVKSASVCPYETSRTVASSFGLSLGRSGPVRPQHADPQPADPERHPGPCRDDPVVMRAGGRDGRALVRAGRRDPRIEDDLRRDRGEHVGGASDVVSFRMGQHDHGKRADAEPS